MNSINKGTDTDASNKEAQEKLLFFNYHEYSLKNYALVGADQEDIHDQALIVTHFPNPYVLRGSKLFHETRVVRIPRLFNYDKFLVPQFSTCLPGGEPAAIVDETSQGFQVKGEFARQFFGTSSSSPLNEYLSDEEFKSIVKGVNELIKRAYNGWSIRNVLLFTLDILSMWFLGDLIRSLTNRVCNILITAIICILTSFQKAFPGATTFH
jgi:hypothetical protein